jgi:lipopolysaccharide export system protein LptC
MKDRLASVVSILLLATLVAGTWWAADYAQRAVVQDPLRRLTHEIDTYAVNFADVRSDANGKPVSRIEGARLDHFPDDDSSDITRFRAVSQRPDRPTLTATSDRARMDQDGARVVMRGNVVLTRLALKPGGPELTVRSEEMTLMPDDDVAFTDLPATIRNGNTTIDGRGMHYDNVSRELRVKQQTRVHFEPKG